MAVLVQLVDGVATGKFPVKKPLLRIGRAAQNDICIDDMLVSKLHAVVEMKENSDPDAPTEYYINDMDSTNCTYVNDKKIKRHKLSNNDVIRVGLNHFKFIDDMERDHGKTTKLHKSWIPGVFYTKDK